MQHTYIQTETVEWPKQLHKLISAQLAQYFTDEEITDTAASATYIENFFNNLPFNFFEDRILSSDEKMILLLPLMPHIIPGFFDTIIQEFLPQGGEFPEFGGVKSGNHRGMQPTGETALFILGGRNLNRKLDIQKLFAQEHFFYRQNIIWLEHVKEGEPQMSGKIILSQEWVDKILFGKIEAPKFSLSFPAKRITTKMKWNDLVLNDKTHTQINDIKIWLQYQHILSNDFVISKKVKPGYRALFYGPPGTGKTLTASLLGQEFKKDVYRVDLSQIVSKYIGETQQNLEKIFSKAENKNWILFFDEGDALFGKRTTVSTSIDRHSNQEISYLLQRVEDFSGLIVLASNFKSNLDNAFLRRFNALIYFPLPDAAERLELWKKIIPEKLNIAPDVDLKYIASTYELTGASIANVMQYAALKTYAENKVCITMDVLIDGIRKEFFKEDKSV